MDAKMRIEIEYCVPCGYLNRAIEMSQQLLASYPQSIESLALMPSAGGRFEIAIDGETVFSKAATGRFPDVGEVKASLRERMRAA